MNKLTAEEVRNIRERLGWSRAELGCKIQVSEAAIKKWEDEERGCGGPESVLLRLLERVPKILDILSTPSKLPSPDAPAGSLSWFQMQRLLGLMQAHRGNSWGDFVKTEGLTPEWFHMLEALELVYTDPRTKVRMPTASASSLYELNLWNLMAYETGSENAESLPAMTADKLENIRSRASQIEQVKHKQCLAAWDTVFASRRWQRKQRFSGY